MAGFIYYTEVDSLGGRVEGVGQAESRTLGLWPEWPLLMALASGWHAGFSHSESSEQLQMAQFPPGWKAESSGVAQESPT